MTVGFISNHARVRKISIDCISNPVRVREPEAMIISETSVDNKYSPRENNFIPTL